MTATATLPAPPPATITRDQIRELRDIVGYERYAVHPIVSALRDAHPGAEYDPNDGSGAAQILAEHYTESLGLARELVKQQETETAARQAEEAAESQAQTAGAKLARIRDAIKAGLRKTDRGELATPETYAQAKAAAEAEQEATALRAEGHKEAATVAKRIAKAKAEAVAAAKDDLPGLLRRDELDQAVADARAAIDRVRALGAEHDEAIRQHVRAFAAAGFESRWGHGYSRRSQR